MMISSSKDDSGVLYTYCFLKLSLISCFSDPVPTAAISTVLNLLCKSYFNPVLESQLNTF